MIVDKITFGKRLKELRVEQSLTMDMVICDIEAAFGIKAHRGLLSKYENGINLPSIQWAIILSQYYQVSIEYLMGITDYRMPVIKYPNVRGM